MKKDIKPHLNRILLTGNTGVVSNPDRYNSMNLKHLFQLLIIAMFSISLVGCIHLGMLGMTEKKCKELNAYIYGRTDALSAIPKEVGSFINIKETCTQIYQITPNQAEYDKGYKKGIKELCTYAGGLSLGQRKGYNPNIQTVCPQKDKTEFARGYRDGALIYYQRKIESVQSENFRLKREIEQIESVQSENFWLKREIEQHDNSADPWRLDALNNALTDIGPSHFNKHNANWGQSTLNDTPKDIGPFWHPNWCCL